VCVQTLAAELAIEAFDEGIVSWLSWPGEVKFNTFRKRRGRKRALRTRAPMAIPQEANQRWSLDFVSDALSDGRKFRVLCVIDDFSRGCLATVVDNSLSGQRVARELDTIAMTRGYPCMIVSDNGTELTSNAILGWQ
jgi:putative transposase